MTPAAVTAQAFGVATLTVGLAQLNDALIMVGVAMATLAALFEWTAGEARR